MKAPRIGAIFRAFALMFLSIYGGEAVWSICLHYKVKPSAFEEMAGYLLPVAIWWLLRRVWSRRFKAVEGV